MHPVHGKITVAKGKLILIFINFDLIITYNNIGLPIKVIDTEDGGKDDAADQWKVEGCKELIPVITKVDKDLSKAGYKTLGVSVKINDGPFQFVGILPMLDPPRHDTAKTIKNLVNAGLYLIRVNTNNYLYI